MPTLGDHTDDSLLGGRVRHAQPLHGFRSGIEPVLLAASIPARPAERVLEGGSGAGAALLCLAARVPGLRGTGVEQDPALVALARRNAAANGWPELDFAAGDVATLSGLGLFDHAFANPPYHFAASTPSPDPSRHAAKRGDAGLLSAWAAALAGCLRPRGTLSFILAAAALPACLEAFAAAGCRPAALLPLWPQPDRAAKLVLLRGVKGGSTPLRILPGLALHARGGGFTPAAEAILRDGQALSL